MILPTSPPPPTPKQPHPTTQTPPLPPHAPRSELWLGNQWLGANALPIVMASLFVMLSGAYLEWLVALMMQVGGVDCTCACGCAAGALACACLCLLVLACACLCLLVLACACLWSCRQQLKIEITPDHTNPHNQSTGRSRAHAGAAQRPHRRRRGNARPVRRPLWGAARRGRSRRGRSAHAPALCHMQQLRGGRLLHHVR